MRNLLTARRPAAPVAPAIQPRQVARAIPPMRLVPAMRLAVRAARPPRPSAERRATRVAMVPRSVAPRRSASPTPLATFVQPGAVITPTARVDAARLCRAEALPVGLRRFATSPSPPADRPAIHVEQPPAAQTRSVSRISATSVPPDAAVTRNALAVAVPLYRTEGVPVPLRPCAMRSQARATIFKSVLWNAPSRARAEPSRQMR